MSKQIRYTFSLVKQGSHRMYSLTIPSSILKKTTYVTNREDDTFEGFQRTLDKKRAQEIANYLDAGGTIPNSIVLSAQPAAKLKVQNAGRSLEFTIAPKAFLILDGQHRVYGFHLAETETRIPVIIYNGLTKSQEAKLFLDINTKQRPVPQELILDIRNLAEEEDDDQELMRDVFDLFDDEIESALLGMMSPSKKAKNKISRATFNGAVKLILNRIPEKQADKVFTILNNYFYSIFAGFQQLKLERNLITNPIIFKALIAIFPDVAVKVKNKFGADFTVSNFNEVLNIVWNKQKASKLRKPGLSYKIVSNELKSHLNSEYIW